MKAEIETTKNLNRTWGGMKAEIETTKNLNRTWGGKQVVLSFGQAKSILKAFQTAGVKKSSECLIFKDTHFFECRRAGEQHKYRFTR